MGNHERWPRQGGPGFLGGIEAGGTKFICVVADNTGTVIDRCTIPTTLPSQTLAEVAEFFHAAESGKQRLEAIGAACFGPVQLDMRKPDYGCITNTPKAGWEHAPIVGFLRREFEIPIGFETDVNGAALGEGRGGAADSLRDYAYVTVGTGIGAGLVNGGRIVRGLSHPEVGHMRVPRHPDDQFAGTCPFHGDCLEGLASGPALAARWGLDPRRLPDDHPAWRLQAHYLACLCHNLTGVFAPERILLGGGVMRRHGLIERVRERFLELAGDYFSWISKETSTLYIQPPGHGGRSGEIGALILAERALAEYGSPER